MKPVSYLGSLIILESLSSTLYKIAKKRKHELLIEVR